MRKHLLLIAMLIASCFAFAQQKQTGMIYGKVTDELKNPIDLANVAAIGSAYGVTTNARGYYELSLPCDTTWEIAFSFIGFEQKQEFVNLKSGEKRKLDVTLISTAQTLPDAVISDRAIDASSLTRLNAKQATLLPSMGGGVENLIKTSSIPFLVSFSIAVRRS